MERVEYERKGEIADEVDEIMDEEVIRLKVKV